MPHFARGSCGAMFLSLLGGAVTVLLVGQVVLGSLSLGAPAAGADEHRFQNLRAPVAATGPVGQMKAAVSTGQFEELARPTPAPTTVPTPFPLSTPTAKPVEPAVPVFERGVASTYGEGDGFEGNLTACGQVFHTLVVQVAHKSLPCGTTLRIEDADTGRSVVAEVTDRGPYISGRVVDLSWGAFEQLDPTGPGLLNVKLYVLDQ